MLNAKLTWKIDPVRTAEKITSGLRNKALRIALQAAAAPTKQAVINAAPAGLGLLRRSIRIRIKHYRKGDAWVAVVGSTSAFKRARKTTDARTGRSRIVRDRDGNKQWVQPARYQFPLDRGGKKNSPRNFIAEAFAATRTQFEQIAAFKLREQFEQIAREAAR